MNDIDASLPELSKLIDERLALLRTLAKSLEASTGALARNDAEAIARGAAHQAELCWQWSRLEGKLRRAAAQRTRRNPLGISGDAAKVERAAELQAEWETLGARIRYLTRVHWSLLRHLERSLAIIDRVATSCAPTYTAGAALAATGLAIGAGEKSCRV